MDNIQPEQNIYLQIPDKNLFLTPGCKVKLGRFSTERWVVGYGWYTWGGNRPVCGWFVVDASNSEVVKPLQLPDMYDIYIIEQ